MSGRRIGSLTRRPVILWYTAKSCRVVLLLAVSPSCYIGYAPLAAGGVSAA